MNLFLVWAKYQSRSETLTNEINNNINDIKIVYRENKQANKFKKICMYISYIIKDFCIILKNKPSFIVVQLPPTYILIAPLIYKKMYKKTTIVGDMHNIMFRDKWYAALGNKFLVSKIDNIIAHNSIVMENIASLNLYQYKARKNDFIVLEDRSIENRSNKNEIMEYQNKKNEKEKIIFFPASFNEDEPIVEFIKVAKKNPLYNFLITGNPKKLKENFNINLNDLPNNLKMTGWLSKEDYDFCVQTCDILIGLTRYEDIQMSVSNEGLSFNVPMVLSDTKTLKSIYKDAAIYVKNESESISLGIEEALKNKDQLILHSKEVLYEKNQRYNQQFTILKKKLGSKIR